VLGAGRTDAGVHARGQVVAFDVAWRHDRAALRRALNANLPPDVAVRSIEGVPRDFHPRFDAKRRTYQYAINNQIDSSPLLRRRTWHRSRPLDLPSMQEASTLLVGEHDFATFGRPPSGENSQRHVFRADWEQDGTLLSFTIEANAFLQRMVRSLVGSLCLVGEGQWSVSTFAEVFAAADRALAGPTAPPQGLCLLGVTY
jgi:tRNA pseudouridine38-40 synthase